MVGRMRDMEKKGNRLRVALKRALRKNEDTVSSLADKIGVSQGYLSQLLNGDKPIDSVSNRVFENFASYLCISKVMVFMLADLLSAEDFYEKHELFSDKLRRAIEAIKLSDDAIVAGVDGETLENVDENVKLLLVLLHQRAFRTQLLDLASLAKFRAGQTVK